jgi:heme-degrading monooxygenase HmoA
MNVPPRLDCSLAKAGALRKRPTGDAFMLRIIWRFRAKAKRIDEFRSVYGWKGKWAKLFGRSPEYQGTILLQDTSDPLVFIVIDRWASTDAFDRFQKQFRPDYESLDQQCNELTDEETLIGNFHDEAV